MVTVGKFYDFIEIQLAQAKLASHDIESFIADEYVAQMDFLLINAMGGIRLQVAQEDFTQATQLIEEFRDSLKVEEQACSCGSKNIAKTKMSFWTIVLYFFNILLPIPSRRKVCLDCGNELSPPTEKETA